MHINRFAQALFAGADGGALFVLGDESLPAYQREGDVEILRLAQPLANFLDRTLAYSRLLRAALDEQRDTLRLCHFRDPWSGVPILENKTYKAVYEINGLPSIELPHTYGELPPQTLAKIRRAEAFCWTQADAIVTPSQTLKENLVKLGVAAEKITVIPNGADVTAQVEGMGVKMGVSALLPDGRDDAEHELEAEPSGSQALLPPPASLPVGAPPRYLLYFGALQRWQGVDVLLKAFARLADFEDLHLVICCSSHASLAKPYRKLAERLEIAERVHWFYGLEEAELAPWRAQALLSVAPLTECPRNLEQGCCPLKILESMAAGVPVVASDIPAVRELIRDQVDGRLVRPERPAELAQAIRVLLEYPATLREMGERAQARIAADFTWEKSLAQLTAVYQSLCPEFFASKAS